ncbi:MAG TPA: NfeD family protein, partial [Chromatiales bacterium]|nr:NfeD family protein [Chromatiales bacterium]
MMDFLNEHVLWWHWVVFGLLLFIGELLSGTFLLLGIGIAAVVTGLLTWL